MPLENKTSNRDELLAVLAQIRDLVDAALSGRQAATEPAKRKTRADVPSTSRTTLEDHLIAIRDGGFFKLARTAEEINEKIQSIYPCERSRVTTQLWRMVKRKEIRKASKTIDGKKHVAYVW